MKKHITSVFMGLTILLNLILLANTMVVEKNISDLRTYMSHQFSQVQSNIGSIGSNVSNTLEQQSSLFDSTTWSFGEIDAESLTIPLIVSVIPKEVDTSTSATLTANGKSIAMTRDGVRFSGTIPVGLFNSLEAYITFESNGVQHSQSVVTLGMPFEEHLMMLSANYSGSHGFESYSGKFTFDGTVNIDLNIPENNAVTSLKIITTDNGALLQEVALDSSLHNQTADYKLEINLEANHTYESAVVATDSYGLTYRAIVNRQVTGTDATTSDFGQMDWWDTMLILDKSGKVIYDSTIENR